MSVLALGVRREGLGGQVCALVLCVLFLCGLGEARAGDGTPVYTRIISLYSAHTENLVSLGAQDQLIGISTSDDYPAEILDKPCFSYREDPEKFIAARPDLVLVRPMIERSYPQLLGKLRQAGIRVVSLQPTSVGGIYDYWRELARLTGREENGEAMIVSFAQGLSHMAEQVRLIPEEKRPQVYFAAIHKKMKTFAPQSIAIFVLEQAGGINIARDASQMRKTNIAAYGKEKILAKAEDIDVFISQQGRMNPVTREIIDAEPGFMAIKAVREGKVFLVEESLVSRPTLRILQGVQQIHEVLYGENH
ncbi:MAG: ABC transporter substrate-binding protein [Desulfobulbaceae bacterium]|jgi:iron complex transport system substrate-binding protein|nr:ABC transporter substrate-binding protein [Desulfobulbaceae bacterium]